MGVIQNQREFKGYELLSSFVGTGYQEELLDALLSRAEVSKRVYYKPQALMVSFSFTEDYHLSVMEDNRNIAKPRSEIAKLTDRLTKRFTRIGSGRASSRSLFKPHFVWCKEEKLIDKSSSEYQALSFEERSGERVWYTHYHMVIFIDGQYATSQSIYKIFKAMEDEGKLRKKGWRISSEWGEVGESALVKDLNARFNDWFLHASYIAKVETKEEVRGRSWGKSRLPKI